MECPNCKNVFVFKPIITRFANGDLIPIVQDSEELSKLKTPAMCFNPHTREALYNKSAITDPRGLLMPQGWHIASE